MTFSHSCKYKLLTVTQHTCGRQHALTYLFNGHFCDDAGPASGQQQSLFTEMIHALSSGRLKHAAKSQNTE